MIPDEKSPIVFASARGDPLPPYVAYADETRVVLRNAGPELRAELRRWPVRRAWGGGLTVHVRSEGERLTLFRLFIELAVCFVGGDKETPFASARLAFAAEDPPPRLLELIWLGWREWEVREFPASE